MCQEPSTENHLQKRGLWKRVTFTSAQCISSWSAHCMNLISANSGGLSGTSMTFRLWHGSISHMWLFWGVDKAECHLHGGNFSCIKYIQYIRKGMCAAPCEGIVVRKARRRAGTGVDKGQHRSERQIWLEVRAAILNFRARIQVHLS